MPDYKVFIAKDTLGGDLSLSDVMAKYYKTFPHDLDIYVKQPEILSKNTYLELLEKINDCSYRNILVVDHANEQGLSSLEFVTGGNIMPWEGMARLLLYLKVKRAYNKIKNKRKPEQWFDLYKIITRSYEMNTSSEAYYEILDDYSESGNFLQDYKNEIKKFKNDRNVDSEIKLIEKIYFDSNIKNYENFLTTNIRDPLSLPNDNDKTLNDYFRILSKVHKKKLNNLAIRGCDIGKHKSILAMIAEFFNVQNINAPRVFILFGMAQIIIKSNQIILRNEMKKSLQEESDVTIGDWYCPWKGNRGANVFYFEENRSALYYHTKKLASKKNELLFVFKETGSHIIAEDVSIIKFFTKRNFGDISAGKRHTLRNGQYLPFYGLDTKPICFPKESRYELYITRFKKGTSLTYWILD